MSFLRALAIAGCLLTAPSLAHHVDPYEVIDRAFVALRDNPDSVRSRAVLSSALRDAPHDGQLDPEFGLVFAVYSDLVRFDGDASFALLLADQGLALAATAAEPDPELRNVLITSRAYALAELGRYREAAEAAAISALWLGERFGDKAREDLEAEAREWARKEAFGEDPGLPSALQTALDLLGKAEDAILARDTATAINLASRAILPEHAGLEDAAVRTVNAWSRWIVGTAYAVEGRDRAAVVALRGAVDLIAAEPWDGKGPPAFREGFAEDTSSRVVWGIFIRLAESALDINDTALAAAALDVARHYAVSPERRHSLLIQQASLLMRDTDLGDVERILEQSEAAALAAGDEANATLVRFYIRVIRLRTASEARTADATIARDMIDAAGRAANAAGEGTQLAEYVLTTAVWQAVIHGVPPGMVLPLGRQAFDVFRARQTMMAGYDAGQDAARRERRRFLETYIDTLYEARQ